MTWIKHDDNCPDHPKIARLSDSAFRLQFNAKCYCSRHLTDGVVPADMLSRILPGRTQREINSLVAELVRGVCFEPIVDGGVVVAYQIHDYLDYQQSRADVLAQRKAAAERQARRRRHANGTYADAPPSHPPSASESRRDTARTHSSSHTTEIPEDPISPQPPPVAGESSGGIPEPEPDRPPPPNSRAHRTNPRAVAEQRARAAAEAYDPAGPAEPPPKRRRQATAANPPPTPGPPAPQALAALAASVGRGPRPDANGTAPPADTHPADEDAAQ